MLSLTCDLDKPVLLNFSLVCYGKNVIFHATTKTLLFYIDDVVELLGWLNVYVQGVRIIPVGVKTKMNTFCDIAVV